MSYTNPFADLDAHQALMEQLQKAADQCFGVAEQAKEALESLTDHNTDVNAHPDLRALVNEAGNVTTDAVDERIKQHDESESAHPLLLAKLNAALEDTSKIQQAIATALAEHNKVSNSHPDIREKIIAVQSQLGTNDISSMATDLTKVVSTLDEVVNEDIVNLQTADARHDAKILQSQQDIVNIQATLDTVETDLQDLASGDFVRQEDIDRLDLRSFALEMESKLGFDLYDAKGPSLVNWTHSTPVYVGKGKTFDIKFSGATGTNPKYSLAVGQGDFSLSLTDNIVESTTIQLTVGANNQPGDIIYYVVTITNEEGGVVRKVVPAMIARPLDLSRIALRGLPESVEPGNTYKFRIRNLADDQSGRYAYEFDPLATGLVFNKQTAVPVNSEIEVTIPEGATRNSDLTFAIAATDKFSDPQTCNYKIHINAESGSEGFKHTVPTVIVPGSINTIRFSGIDAADGTPATYSIVNDYDDINFSKTEGILTNENIKMYVDARAPRGETRTFKAVSTDKNGVSLTMTINTKVNELPISSNITTTLPTETYGGQSLSMRINGGKDPEAEAKLTYTISAAEGTGLVFTKMSGISNSDVIVVTLPKVSNVTTKTFTVTAVDSEGEASPQGKEISVILDPIYVSDAPQITAPLEGVTLKPPFTMQWTAYSYHTDV